MPAPGTPVTLFGLISTVIVDRNECLTTVWDPDWDGLPEQGYFIVYDPPLPDCQSSQVGDPYSSGVTPAHNPVFTGDPQAPTPAAGDNDTSLATTEFVQTELDAQEELCIVYSVAL